MEIYARMSRSCASGTRWRGRERRHLTPPGLFWTLFSDLLSFSEEIALGGCEIPLVERLMNDCANSEDFG